MIEKVHQLKKNVILCKTVPNDLEKFQQCVPCPPKNGVILPDVCQFTYNTSPPTPREKYPLPLNTTPATFSRVPCVIWELFRRMVYMYVPLFIKYVSNFLYMRYFIGKNCAYSLFSFIFASQIFMYNTSFFSL